jgi:uncharacterized protein YbjQ (UPF0145 family)
MSYGSAELQCLSCKTVSVSSALGATFWNCRCGSSYYLRRCSECQAVSHVPYIQRDGEPWDCVWCHTANQGYRQHGDPAAAVLGDLATDMARRGLEILGGRLAPPLLIVTTNEIPGYSVVQVHGDVLGVTVRARNTFMARLQTLVVGEAPGLTGFLRDSYERARSAMWQEAAARGANAVVGVRLACSGIGEGIDEVSAYGTAVTVEPLAQQVPLGRQAG